MAFAHPLWAARAATTASRKSFREASDGFATNPFLLLVTSYTRPDSLRGKAPFIYNL